MSFMDDDDGGAVIRFLSSFGIVLFIFFLHCYDQIIIQLVYDARHREATSYFIDLRMKSARHAKPIHYCWAS